MIRFVIIYLSFFLFINTYSQTIDLSEKLPPDPAVKIEKLGNGLTYYIRENKKPLNRAYIRLAVNAGSILEDEDQKGLAHFVEHMAFNGTKNFKKHEIINFMESIGMRFGPEVNAYTGFDETVYMLELPMDSIEMLETGFRILRDWAGNISFEQEEIDKERGVIIEEWRLGRGANARMRDKHFSVLFNNSKYAEHLPIGDKNTLENFEYETLTRFYHEWYRPDLMSVVAVGDFNSEEIEKLIVKYFSDLENPDNPRPRKEYELPDHKGTLFSIASDKEATYNIIQTYYLSERERRETVGDFRNAIVQRFFNMMLNDRFNELTKKADPPFLNAFSGNYNLIRTKGTYALSALVKEGGIIRGLETLMLESERIRQFGFTDAELERTKKNYGRAIRKQYEERDKMESHRFASTYVDVFLEGNVIYGIENSYNLYNMVVDGINIEEINELVQTNITENNRVITLSLPENEGSQIPGEEDLNEVFRKIDQTAVTAYEETVSTEPLLTEIPSPGKVVSEKYIEELQVTEWILSNGVKVVLKPTEFKNDQVLFTASSPGGNSLFEKDLYRSAVAATAIVNESGLGDFSNIDLRKKLAGKIVSVHPWIGELREGFEGSSSPEDIETLFKLVYMFFYSPRFENEAYTSFKERVKGYLENRTASPEAAFQDTISLTMTSNHYRSLPWNEELINEIDLEKSRYIYLDRFADADDFTFYFVGNIDLEKMKLLSTTYLANLPALPREETWKDVNVRYPKGHIEKVVVKGVEPKSRVMLKFTGDFEWSPEETYYMESVVDYLDIKLREVLREDKSGTYGVSVWCNPVRWPYEDYEYSITFGCDPERVDELTGEILLQIDSLKSVDPDISYVNKIKEQHLRSRETELEQNSFWLGALHSLYVNQRDPLVLLKFSERVNSLTPEILKNTAVKYFNNENYVRVILKPEEKN